MEIEENREIEMNRESVEYSMEINGNRLNRKAANNGKSNKIEYMSIIS